MDQGRRKRVWLAGTVATLAVACGGHNEASSVVSFHSAVSSDAGAIVVGERVRDKITSGVIYRSADGRSWGEASLPGGVGPLHRVVNNSGKLVAVGRGEIVTVSGPSGGSGGSGGSAGASGSDLLGGQGGTAGFSTLQDNNPGGGAGMSGGGTAGQGGAAGTAGTAGKGGAAGGAGGTAGASGNGQSGAAGGLAGGAAGSGAAGSGQAGAAGSGQAGAAGGGQAGAAGQAGGAAGSGGSGAGLGGSGVGLGGGTGTAGASALGGTGGQIGSVGGGEAAGNAGVIGVIAGPGVVVLSTDGQRWLAASLPPSEPLLDVVAGDAGFVAVGEQKGLYWSSDGSVWVQQSVPGSNDWRSLAAGNGHYVALGENVFTSSNGLSWQLTASVPAGAFSLVRFVGGMFYAVAPGGGLYGGPKNGCTLARSADGQAWQAVAAPIPGCAADVTLEQGEAILAAGAGLYEGTSTESGVWALRSSAKAGESFVAVGSSSYGFLAVTERSIQTSTDGRTWVEVFAAR